MLEVAEIVGRTLNDVYVDVDERMERTDVSAVGLDAARRPAARAGSCGCS